MEPKWLDWAKQLQSIAQTGLAYSKDAYDLERFELVRKISMDILASHTELEGTVIKRIFASDKGYATPKIAIRAVIFQDSKLLLVKEKNEGKWALPGGWADIGLSPSEVAVKEVKEESGFEVKALKLLAVTDKKRHPHPPSLFDVYTMFFLCEIIGGQPREGLETSEVKFFSENELPPLSTPRNTLSQLQMVFNYLKNPEQQVYFD